MTIGIIVMVIGAILFALTYVAALSEQWPRLPAINTVGRVRLLAVLIVAIGAANIVLTVL